MELTVKPTGLLGAEATVTRILPLVAPLGTGTVMLVLLQFTGMAAVPLKVTVLAPWVEPKFAPVRVTIVPMTPSPGENVVITGAPLTVNVTPLLDWPAVVTTTDPVVVPAGTGATIWVSLQLVGVAVFEPKATVPVP